MRIFPFCFYLILLAVPFSISAQSPTQLSGKVIDKLTQEEIPYAAVVVKQSSIGVFTNETGDFTLNFPAGTWSADAVLEIRHLGYANIHIRLGKLDPTTSHTFSLSNSEVILAEVKIAETKQTARELLTAAFGKAYSFFPREPYLQNSFYRHYCRDNGKYGRLIEAAVDLYNPKPQSKLGYTLSDKYQVRVTELRRSYDETNLSNRSHAPISLNAITLVDFLNFRHTITRYKRSPKDLSDKFTFTFGENTVYNNQPVRVVKFAFSENLHSPPEIDSTAYPDRVYASQRDYEGKVWINPTDLSIIAFENHISIKTHLPLLHRTNVHTESWSVKNEQWAKGLTPAYFFREGIDTNYYHLPGKPDSIGYDHHYHIELMVNQTQFGKKYAFEGSAPGALEMLSIPYSPKFWESYNTLLASPLEQEIIRDLEAKVPLEQQFATFELHRKLSRSDSAHASNFYRLLASDSLQPTLVYFWKLEDLPTGKSLKKLERGLKKLAQLPSGLAFVNMDTSEVSYLKGKEHSFPKRGIWNKKIKKFRLLAGSHFRTYLGNASQLAQDFQVAESPAGMLMDHSGKVLERGIPFPDDPAFSKWVKQARDATKN